NPADMADNTEGPSDAQITFKVKASGDKNHTITMAESATILDLKNKLATEEFENIPVERQRLIYSGRVMKNEDTLASYKVKPGNTIHLVKSAASNPTPAPSSAALQPVPRAIPNNMAAGTSADNLLAGLTGARFAGHANLPSANLFGADGGMGAPPSEDQMADMLSNPNIAQAMNEALNNPAMVDLMIQSSPMLRNNPQARQMIQSPMFRQMLTNPQLLRQAAQMRRAMAGGGGADAFPAPGATDTTPAGAPAAGGAERGVNTPNQQNPWGLPGFGMFPLPPATAGGAGENPFMALMNPLGAPPTGQIAAGQAPSGEDATQRSASAAPGSTPDGAPQGGAVNPFGLTPETMQQFMQMMGGPMGEPSMPVDNRPPEERYADQLRQLNEMGFYDFDQNVAALRRSGGNVQGAVNFLLGG
ncbi:ubiquitin-domain-containing protein, partial [Cryphonectria parasitica EP155]